MNQYSTKEFDLVKGGQYAYFKLYVNGECQFDEFMEEVEKDPRHRKWLGSIFAYMEFISDRNILRKDKFRQINDAGRDDVFEFKKESLRVYVIKQKPNMYIILGGFKNNQTKDISLLKLRVKDFKL